jgi:hypothetical protein
LSIEKRDLLRRVAGRESDYTNSSPCSGANYCFAQIFHPPMTAKIQSPAALPLSASAFYRLVAEGIVVDGRAGGLLIGRRAEEGGIALIRQRGDSFILEKRRVSGGDFVMNEHVSDADYLPKGARLTACCDRECRTILTAASPDDKILWLDWEQMVLPRESVNHWLPLLEAMNEYANTRAFCDLEEVFEPQSVLWQ